MKCITKLHTKRFRLVLSILVLGVGSNAVLAQWKPAGNLGAHVDALASNDSFLFAATTAHDNNTGVSTGSVFRSQNKGKTWQKTSLKTGIVYALATSGPNVFAGTEEGVFHSSNHGLSWKAVNNGLPAKVFDRPVWSLAVSGQNVIAGTQNVGVFVSTDKGQIWKQTNLKTARAVSLFANGSTVLAGTDEMGVWLSTDSGVSWKLIHNNLPGDIQFTVGLTGATMFAAGLNDGIFLSTNSGTSWTKVHDLGGLRVFAPVGGMVLAGGNFGGPVSSQNAGKTWVVTNQGIAQGVGVWAMTGQGSDVYAGDDKGGIYRIANVSPATLSDGSFDKLQVNNPPVAGAKVMFFNIPGCKPMVSQPGKYTCTTRGGLATCKILLKQGKVKVCSPAG